jgi:hypothetical protein
MATTKIGVYRKYHGPTPKDETGRPLPKPKWPHARRFSWVAGWFGRDGKRYSKSFETRRDAERFAEEKQADARQGKADPPEPCTVREFLSEHLRLSRGAVRRSTLLMHAVAWRRLAAEVGWETDL